MRRAQHRRDRVFADEVRPAERRHDAGTGRVDAAGRLSAAHPQLQGTQAHAATWKLAELLREIGKRRGRTTGEVAIAWTLRRPEVTGAIVGMRSPQQLDGVIGAGDFRLSPEEVREIADFMTAHPA